MKCHRAFKFINFPGELLNSCEKSAMVQYQSISILTAQNQHKQYYTNYLNVI